MPCRSVSARFAVISFTAVAGLVVPTLAIAQAATPADSKQQSSLQTAKLASLFKARAFQGDNGSLLRYRYFEPATGHAESARYPVILYLHGEEEAGTDNQAQLTTTECATFWSPGSTASPHDAWYTAFHKFEVIYNSLFLGNLESTQHGEISPTTLYTKRALGNGITQVWDYALGTSYVIERPDKAVIIDTTMGHGSIYQ